jgi:hypothetical protein
MADLSDVEAALATLAMQAAYPNGSSSASITGQDCRVYRGWPLPASLNSDLRNGIVNITVFPDEQAGRVTAFFPDNTQVSKSDPLLSATVVGTSVTFAGTAQTGQLAGLVVDGKAYPYAIAVGDSAASVAANLADLVGADRITTLSGTTVDVPGAAHVVARVVMQNQFQQQTRRQERLFHVACWCPSPAVRDQVAIAIDQVIAPLKFLSFPEGTYGRLLYHGTTVTDRDEDAFLYRRDLIYLVEYPTITTSPIGEMLFGDLNLNTNQMIV